MSNYNHLVLTLSGRAQVGPNYRLVTVRTIQDMNIQS